MNLQFRARRFALSVLVVVPLAGCGLLPEGEEPLHHPPDIPFVVTGDETIVKILELAGLGPADVVYDLGCGDGRIVIAAAKSRGARGFCVDIDPQRISEARWYAGRAGVTDKLGFRTADLFTVDLSPATVVTIYLGPEMNQRLMPKLLKELRPGTRVVSHKFSMGEVWPAEKTVPAGDSTLYLWTIPQRLDPR
jgi:SAM-dependent methyltransferase